MRRHVFIKDIGPGGIAGVYLVRDAKVLKTKSGDDYASLALSDKTGEIPAKIWQAPPDVLDACKPGTYLNVVGDVELYRERPQIIVQSFEPQDAGTVDAALYKAIAPVDPEVTFADVRAMLDGMKDEWLRKLAVAYLDDPEFAGRLRDWPAARAMHHPYMHGLLEHVHSAMRLGVQLAAHYPWVDADLVLMGLFLHDSGKVIELKLDPAPDYSVEGEMLGHITIGICDLDRRARLIEGFPHHRLTQLKHIILSHHENPDYGSPKPPMLPEAQLIHTVEMLDGKMNAFLRERVLPAENQDETGGLRYSRLLKRRVYTPPQGK